MFNLNFVQNNREDVRNPQYYFKHNWTQSIEHQASRIHTTDFLSYCIFHFFFLFLFLVCLYFKLFANDCIQNVSFFAPFIFNRNKTHTFFKLILNVTVFFKYIFSSFLLRLFSHNFHVHSFIHRQRFVLWSGSTNKTKRYKMKQIKHRMVFEQIFVIQFVRKR